MIALDGIMKFPELFADFLIKKTYGEVLLVTSKGVYLRFEKHIIFLSDSRFGATPIGVTLEDMDFLTSAHIENGQKIYHYDHSIFFPDAVIKLHIKEYTRSCNSLLPSQIIQCAHLLHQHQNTKGVSSLCCILLDETNIVYANPLCAAAHPLLDQLIEGLHDCNQAQIRCAVRSLLGMGIGLTPSLDDVLLGMLYTLKRIAPDCNATRFLMDTIKECASEFTNDISAAYLQAVADGAPFQHLDEILSALSDFEPLNIKPILQIGSSSGSEMLFGLLLAAKLIYL